MNITSLEHVPSFVSMVLNDNERQYEMTLKKRIEILEQEDEGHEEFAEWGVVVSIGKEKRTFARNEVTGQESEDPNFVHHVSSWHRDRAKRLGITEDIVVVIGTPETGQETYRNGVLVESIPETTSGMVSCEMIVKGA